MADRIEESNAWHHPIDLVAMLQTTFDRLPALRVAGQGAAMGDDPAHASPELRGVF